MFYFILEIVLQFGEGVLSNFLLDLFVSDAGLVCAIGCLEDSFCSLFVNVVTVLRICADYEFHGALGTFHSELVYFCGVEVVDPGFHGVESDSFGYHVLATLASNMEGSLVSYFASSNSFSFDYFERFFMLEVTFSDFHFVGVKVFRSIVAVCS